MVRSFTAVAAAIATIAPLHLAAAQSCAELDGREDASTNPLRRGQLFALFGSNGSTKFVPLRPGWPTEVDFSRRIKLVYVVDGIRNAPLVAAINDRDHAGVIAVKLVSTASDPNRPLRPPQLVTVSRDEVAKRGGSRRALHPQEVPATSYYVYHHPRGLRSSDSFLERQFHTEYTVRASEPDRQTYDPRDRRTQFHFPQMVEPEPTDLFSQIGNRIAGSGRALAATRETRFESQIKYYRRSALPRCVTIETHLQRTDDGTLIVTLIDLDHAGGPTHHLAAEQWEIQWKPVRAGAR